MSELADFADTFLEKEYAVIRGRLALDSHDERMAVYRAALMCHAPKPFTPAGESWSTYGMDISIFVPELSQEERLHQLEQIGPRTLFKRTYYTHPALGEVLRAYLSDPTTMTVRAYSRRIDIAAVNGRSCVIGYSWLCKTCFGMGQVDGEVCRARLSDDNPACQDGWWTRGGMTLNHLSTTPTRVERLATPDEPRSIDVHAREA